MTAENSNTTKKKQFPLLGLVLIASAITSASLFAISLLFVWLEHETVFVSLNQNQLFAVVRNTVTAGAAIGLGATLVISYRKQQTAEHAQETAHASMTATLKSLEISNRATQNTRDSDLRERYISAANLLAQQEQTLVLAGISALEELSDDWADHGNKLAQSSVVRLLALEAARYTAEDSKSAPYNALEQTILRRLKAQESGRQDWGNFHFTLKSPDPNSTITDETFDQTIIQDILLRQGGSLQLVGKTKGYALIAKRVFLDGGKLDFSTVEGDFVSLKVEDSNFREGTLQAGLLSGTRLESISFSGCQFDAAIIDVPCRIIEPEIDFTECMFLNGANFNTWHFHQTNATFVDCSFASSTLVPESWGQRHSIQMENIKVGDRTFVSKEELFDAQGLVFASAEED